ncbi:MAG TPA: metallopeptidase TldD-related protein [Candidatus Acidoferrales bacterium]|nr:metallopeptidase TldD-related protein [Candidatus Acidoferrales bacterium]
MTSSTVRTHPLSILFLVLVAAAIPLCGTAGSPGDTPAVDKPKSAPKSVVIQAMEEEIERTTAGLAKATPPPYFISYRVTEQQRAEVQGSNGALLSSEETHTRWLQTTVRVGSYELDDTHRVGGADSGSQASYGTSAPVDDDPAVLRRLLWQESDRQYRGATEALLRIQTGRDVKVESTEAQAPDFSHETPHESYGPHVSFQLDRRPWEEKVRLYTNYFRSSAAVLNSIVSMSAQAQNNYLVTSEGTRLQFGLVRYRLELFIQGKASDGMDINRYANFDWVEPSEQPDDKTVLQSAGELVKEMEALVKAPLVEPAAVPTLLTGRAAAVYFHEMFGHRAEGHRQKDVREGQTFTKKVGEQILPDFLSIYDDPTQKRMGKEDLLGYYPYDDEGVPSEHVVLVDHGVLKNFEMSRSPLLGFPHSNGHGRAQTGLMPVSRQGNLVVQSSKQVSNAELRKMLIEEVKKQGKPFGLVIDDIAGGFTFTGRGQPQVLQVTPLVVYQVYADGRPDLLVRGVDVIATPLVSLTKIVATGDTPEVFNGYCGAESGSVPVAAVSPAILISEMEVQKKETSTDRPPILPPPAHDPLATGAKP